MTADDSRSNFRPGQLHFHRPSALEPGVPDEYVDSLLDEDYMVNLIQATNKQSRAPRSCKAPPPEGGKMRVRYLLPGQFPRWNLSCWDLLRRTHSGVMS